MAPWQSFVGHAAAAARHGRRPGLHADLKMRLCCRLFT